MKLTNIENLDGLFKIVNGCKGQVHLISQEGDDIVLTSKLSRFVLESMKNDEENGKRLANELEIVCDDPNDTIKFIEFLAYAAC